jgi:hypothetical protein
VAKEHLNFLYVSFLYERERWRLPFPNPIKEISVPLAIAT